MWENGIRKKKGPTHFAFVFFNFRTLSRFFCIRFVSFNIIACIPNIPHTFNFFPPLYGSLISNRRRGLPKFFSDFCLLKPKKKEPSPPPLVTDGQKSGRKTCGNLKGRSLVLLLFQLDANDHTYTVDQNVNVFLKNENRDGAHTRRAPPPHPAR